MNEVEETLREIRERVRAESVALTRASSVAAVGGDGAGAARDEAGEAFARMEANLATAERARERLPPLVSNRAGLSARVELWVKRKIKRALHWFTWEQVNFNAATTHALSDALAALRAHERRLAEMQAELTRLGQLQERLEEMARAHVALETRVEAHVAQLRDEGRERAAQLRDESREHFAQLRDESRERVEHLLEEQRVCYRQLSLEASESAVLFDRARRDIESRLARIEKSVASDE
ncbi:MAG TPA: hypothetical protein VFX96_18005 [Pyrinomonadaceae bacterium]|nr:hypothetical protein [Pyrinomonadaceae bacterium]